MALKMNIPDDDFLTHVLQGNTLAVTQLLTLRKAVFTFFVDLDMLRAAKDNQSFSLTLKVTSSSLMKNLASSSPDIKATKEQIVKFIEHLYVTVHGGGIPSFLQKGLDIPPAGVGTLSQVLEAVHASLVPGEKKPNAIEKPPADLEKPIKLSSATALGQAVTGTSVNSIYRLIAYNSRVKIAVRMNGSQLSLRVEGNPDPSELGLIKTSCMIWHGSYGSMHLQLSGAPRDRVIGAYLYGLGVRFDHIIAPGEEIPV